MLKSLRWVGLPLLLALVLPVFAVDKKDKKKKDDDDEPKEAKAEKPSYAGSFVATVTKVSASSQKEFSVQIKYEYKEVNQQAYLSYQQNMALKQRQVAISRTPAARQQALADLIRYSQQPQNFIQIKTMTKDVDLRADDNIKVRALRPPIDYDDKGNVKKYTKKELAELKGPDKSLPGYTADFEALQPKQVVKVYLAKDKAGAKKPKKAMKKKKKKKDDDDDDDSLEDESKPQAGMVVIVAEPRMQE